MAGRFDLVVSGGVCVTPRGVVQADLGIRRGRVVELGGLGSAAAAERLDARGLHLLPGVIDGHVHFREPGFESKEDLESGSRAALAGGVTAVVEMPNTRPATTSAEALADKVARCAGRIACDVGFYAGATPDNLASLGALEREPGCAGIKLFLGRSTGGLLVETDAALERALSAVARPLAVHAEDEARLEQRRELLGAGGDVSRHPEWRDAESAWRASQRVLAAARRLGRRVHLLHVTTAEEVELLRSHRDVATAEVTPQHLLLEAPDCYVRLGTRAQVNPPIRDAHHRRALWGGLREGLLDCIGSDHAPHTLEEKSQPYPGSPSGMPGVETLLPLMLDRVAAGELTLERLVQLVSTRPAALLGLSGRGRLEPGSLAHLTLVDLAEERLVEAAPVRSRCGWSAFDGSRLKGWPRAVVLGGRVAMRDGEIVGPPAGRVLAFGPAG
jgi:dihydroorotase